VVALGVLAGRRRDVLFDAIVKLSSHSSVLLVLEDELAVLEVFELIAIHERCVVFGEAFHVVFFQPCSIVRHVAHLRCDRGEGFLSVSPAHTHVAPAALLRRHCLHESAIQRTTTECTCSPASCLQGPLGGRLVLFHDGASFTRPVCEVVGATRNTPQIRTTWVQVLIIDLLVVASVLDIVGVIVSAARAVVARLC